MATHSDHYARTDQIIRCATSLTEVFDILGREQQRAVLDVLLPGVDDPFACWDELHDPIERLDRLDYRTAVDEMHQRGARGAVDPETAYGQLRGEIEWEIRGLLNSHRRDGAPSRAALVAVSGGVLASGGAA